MKRNEVVTIMAMMFGLVIGTVIGNEMMPARVKTEHTFQNIAIYYAADNGYIVDEDGRRFNVDFKELPDQAVLEVTYDNKGTVTRLDDKPLSYTLLDETLETRR